MDGLRTVVTASWCFCGGEEVGEMIYAIKNDCQIKWLHTDCLKITNVPKGKWYCPECRKTRKNRKMRK